MKERFRKRYSVLEEPVHGGTPLSDGVLDFSISVNPFALPESVSDAYAAAWNEISRYPDTGSLELKASLAERYSADPGRLLITSGSSEAFGLIAASFLDADAVSMIVSPCYSDYEKVSRASGAGVVEYRLNPADGFGISGDSLLEYVSRHEPDLVWLCSPNNPTGVVINPGLIEELASAAAAWDGMIILDEAYASFVPAEFILPRKNYSNIVRVHSMTKDFGIPGLRLGWIEASPEIIRCLNLNRPSWSVSHPAQHVGLALMDEFGYFQSCWSRVKGLRDDLILGLEGAGISAMALSDNKCGVFVFFRLPERIDSSVFLSSLGAAGIRIRDCSSMGAPGYFRAGVRTREDNLRFIEAAGKIIEEERNR